MVRVFSRRRARHANTLPCKYGPILPYNLSSGQTTLLEFHETSTMREPEGRFSMAKFGITLTAFFLLLGALALASAQLPFTKNTILVNRIGPSGGELFIANGDGSGERKLNSGGNMDYDAMFSTDGKWIVFTSERNGSAIFSQSHRTVPDSSG